MTSVLVADDSPSDRHLVRALLEKEGIAISEAVDGRDALEKIAESPPEIVLTDMQMPEMGGLELVDEMRRLHPTIPVVLITAHGSEEVAVTALQRGAASYVPKKNFSGELARTVRMVRGVARIERGRQRTLDCLMRSESHFVLDNDKTVISGLVRHLQERLREMSLCDETDLIRVGSALQEALCNAIEHGNLELSSQFRSEASGEEYSTLYRRRQQQSPYCDRRVHLTVRQSRYEATYTLRDEGPGFDPLSIPDPRDPANLQRATGRGLLLMQTFMDEVHFGETGNMVTMIKRASLPADARSSRQ